MVDMTAKVTTNLRQKVAGDWLVTSKCPSDEVFSV